MINIIVAISKNGIIGSGNQLPWHISEDLKYFKKITSGKIVLMGRKTFESIGKPLPNRKNVVITRNKDFFEEGILIFDSLEEAFNELSDENLFVIGGASIYKQTLPFADKMYVTFIDMNFDGDVKFPKIDKNVWKICSESKTVSSDGIPLSFRIYERKSGDGDKTE